MRDKNDDSVPMLLVGGAFISAALVICGIVFLLVYFGAKLLGS